MTKKHVTPQSNMRVELLGGYLAVVLMVAYLVFRASRFSRKRKSGTIPQAEVDTKWEKCCTQKDGGEYCRYKANRARQWEGMNDVQYTRYVKLLNRRCNCYVKWSKTTPSDADKRAKIANNDALTEKLNFPPDFNKDYTDWLNKIEGQLDHMGCAGPMACLSMSTGVQTSTGIKMVKELRVGDLLRTASGGTTRLTEFLHHNSTDYFEMVCIKHEGGGIVKLTPEHVIFRHGSNGDVEVTFASDIQIGDVLYGVEGGNNNYNSFKVAETKRTIEIGASSPLTENGEIVCGDVVVSCFAHTLELKLAKLALKPLMQWDGTYRTPREGIIHPYAESLLILAKDMGMMVSNRIEMREVGTGEIQKEVLV